MIFMPPTSRLVTLRANLLALASRRKRLRWGTGWCGFGLALLAIGAMFFVVDYSLGLTVSQRIVAWGAALCAGVWAARTYLLPYLGQHESAQEMALFVERQQHIDSDLIAALQFEDDARGKVADASSQLRNAVVDYVADYSRGLNVFAGLDRGAFARRAAWFVAGSLLAIGLCVAYPAYANAFFQRLTLSKARYPTNVVIDKLWVNGVELDPYQIEERALRIAYGRPIVFEAQLADGSKVDSTATHGKVVLTGDAATRVLPLARRDERYRVELPQLFDAIGFTFRIGDAESETGRVVVIPLPVVELRLTPHSPDYVRADGKEAPVDPGSRQITVVEGSSVDVELSSTNKPLKSVVLTALMNEKKEYPLIPIDGSANVWRMPAAAGPLANITEPVKFELRVVDADDLALPTPIEGIVRVKPDRPPTSTMTAKVLLCTPTATPILDIRATDDYGLAGLRLRVEVLVGGKELRGAEVNESGFGGSNSGDRTGVGVPATSTAVRKQPEPVEVAVFDPPLRGRDKLPYVAPFKLDLAPFGLKKGDQLKVVLEATDDRGTQTGVASLGDPLFFQISDNGGVIAAMSEYDAKADRELESILKVQTGGNP